MISDPILPLADQPHRESFLSFLIDGFQETSQRYLEWLFGDFQEIRKKLEIIVSHRYSTFSLYHSYLYLYEENPAGFITCMTGEDNNRSRKLDAFTWLNKTDQEQRQVLLERLKEIGLLSPEIDKDTFYLSTIYVHADFRGKKIGEKLFCKFLEIGHTKGFFNFQLEVLVNNLPAIRLYEKYGFQIIRENTGLSSSLSAFSMLFKEPTR